MSAATASLRPLLDQVRHAWRASPLPAFFAWWGGELGKLLPPRWRAALGGGASWHLLQQDDGDWRLRRAGQAEPLARWSDGLDAPAQQAALAAAWRGSDPAARRLALLLPAHAALRRSLQLPLVPGPAAAAPAPAHTSRAALSGQCPSAAIRAAAHCPNQTPGCTPPAALAPHRWQSPGTPPADPRHRAPEFRACSHSRARPQAECRRCG